MFTDAAGPETTHSATTGPDTPPRTGADDERELLAAAAEMARVFSAPSQPIYWADLTCTAILGYGAFALLLATPAGAASAALYVCAVLAFYRGLSFIHELTHIRRDKLPGFAPAWNILFGIPLLTPSFMYDDVHVVHHARTTYGTPDDPEYLPFASLGPWTSRLFLVSAAGIPIALLLRYGLLAPVGLVNQRARRSIVERFSALAINPAFRRRKLDRAARAEWIVLETAACGWALFLVMSTLFGVMSWRAVLTGFLVGSGVALTNQVRTLASHVWANGDKAAISLTAQYLDSVNVPAPALLPALWAPVGLRYHALHHLLPSVPYHALGKAHRALSTRLSVSATVARADHRSLTGLLIPLLLRRR